MVDSLFGQLGLLVVIAAASGILMRPLKLPPLVGFVLAGVLTGPLLLNEIPDHETLASLRQLGLALLLFLVGLELDWKTARRQLKSAAGVTVAQAAGTLVLGTGLGLLLGMNLLASFLLGVAFSFSSSVIVVKLLGEDRELRTVHGRLSVGNLLAQDVLAMLALVVITGIASAQGATIPGQLAYLAVKVAALLALTWVLSTHILPAALKYVARHGELLFLSSVAWCFIYTFTVHWFAVPVEMGALLAGVSLASTPYAHDIMNRIRSIRDFFVIIFFAALGAEVGMPHLSDLGLILGAVMVVVFVRPVLTFALYLRQGYRSRSAFLAGVTQSQLSEFSLILVGIAATQGFFPKESAHALTFVTLVSIVLSAYLFRGRMRLLRAGKHLFKHLELREAHAAELETDEIDLRGHTILVGYHRMGFHILKTLQGIRDVVVVDMNPESIRKLREQGVPAVYGDVDDEELYDLIGADQASVVVSTIPHPGETRFLIEQVLARNPKCRVIVTANELEDALEHYHAGASYVVMPHLLSGEYVANVLHESNDAELGKHLAKRAEELKILKARQHALYDVA